MRGAFSLLACFHGNLHSQITHHATYAPVVLSFRAGSLESRRTLISSDAYGYDRSVVLVPFLILSIHRRQSRVRCALDRHSSAR